MADQGMLVVAITRSPTEVYRQLSKIRQPLSNRGGVDSGCATAHQRAKRIEICRIRSLGGQIRIEELVMRDLIIHVVMNVIGHFVIQDIQGVGVDLVPCSTGDFVISSGQSRCTRYV